jgi:hypothetical protein
MTDKSQLICFRADPATKARIEAAAERVGQSLTTFLRAAAERAVQKAEASKPAGDKAHAGVPWFFRARCLEASRGGDWGYRGPGYHLARHLAAQSPYEFEWGEWAAELAKLSNLLFPTDRRGRNGESDAAVLAWFDEHYPKPMKLVPRRRRQQFLEGVYEAVEDETIGLDL